MENDEYYNSRNKNIILVYKNLQNGTMETEQLKGRTTEDFNLIAAAMLRSFDKDPNIYLHRKEGEGMKVISVPIRKNFGTESKKALHQLVYVEYVVDPDVV